MNILKILGGPVDMDGEGAARARPMAAVARGRAPILPWEGRGAVGKGFSGLCRPGFLIIGAGKCGTSSLYQYLIGHDRVLPAKEKQIHYFKYYAGLPMEWYYKRFPSTESFLSSGALVTGEAAL